MPKPTWFGGTATSELAGQIKSAAADKSISGILLVIDSPGGSVVGVPELANEVFNARQQKPFYGFSEGLCASAAYWIGSQCTALFSTVSGQVGSVGVYAEHDDVSKAMNDSGIKPTLISAGKYKTEGNSYEPLGTEARAAIQGQVDSYYGMFTSAVAKGRSVPVSAVRGGFGQGRCLLAGDALTAGMIDGICTLQDVINRMSAQVIKPALGASNNQRPNLNNAMRMLQIANLK